MSKRSSPNLITRRRFIKIGGTGAVAVLAQADQRPGRLWSRQAGRPDPLCHE